MVVQIALMPRNVTVADICAVYCALHLGLALNIISFTLVSEILSKDCCLSFEVRLSIPPNPTISQTGMPTLVTLHNHFTFYSAEGIYEIGQRNKGLFVRAAVLCNYMCKTSVKPVAWHRLHCTG